MKLALIVIPAALLSAWVVIGYLSTKNVPMPKYSVIIEKESYEIRQYEPYVLAETPMSSGSGDSGFREMFNYISGSNRSNSKRS
jgi:hypothetical protein